MTVLHYLENTAHRLPDKPAVIDESSAYTFSELREKALSAASVIHDKLAGRRNEPVLVYMPKGKESVAAYLGIVYSGNTYVPTDMRVPFPHIQGLIDVLKPALYISDGECALVLRDNGVPDSSIIVFDGAYHGGSSDSGSSVVSGASNSETCSGASVFDVKKALGKAIDADPVNVLFTSGSTGVPKGVTITHRSIIDYVDWVADCFGVTELDVIGNQAHFYFDHSILDFFLCLKTGATLHLIPEQHYTFPLRLVKYIEENKVSFLLWVPSVLCYVADQGVMKEADLSCLRVVLFAGEVMPNKQLNHWRAHIPQTLFANLYGPTEITVDCTYFIVDRPFADDEPLPIGIPCANTDILLLNEENTLVTEPGEQGEICVRGSSLAVGYYNLPDMTEEKFCQNPLQSRYPEYIYRTGDVGHYNDRGEIMFDGRMDFQIKHMGYRIELGEIETAAQGCDGVLRAACIYDAPESKIILFFTGSAAPAEITAFLRKKLPRYMLPRIIKPVEEMPLTATAKIDRKQLRASLDT